MKNLVLFLFVLSTIVLTSCESKPDLSKYETTISGILYNVPGQEIILVHQTPEGIFALDTTYVEENGDFLFTPDVEEVGVYRVMIDFSQYITVIVNKGDHVFIDADGLDIYDNYIIEGSEESDLVRLVVEEALRYNKQFDSTKIVINHETAAKNGKALMTAFDYQKLLHANHRQFIIDFINQHPGSIASYFLVIQLPAEEEPDLYKQVAKNITNTYPHFSFLPELTDQIDVLNIANEGTLAQEMNYPSPSGDSIKLSSLRGKYVLIDFWASWCKPCREENPTIVKLYEKYKDQGFEIYGYSIDEKKESWMKAIEDDGITWIQTSDLKGWAAEGSILYGVQAIPATFLIDPNGVIMAKNIRGVELETKLIEIFGE